MAIVQKFVDFGAYVAASSLYILTYIKYYVIVEYSLKVEYK